jgi:hypothetical protein
MKHRKLSFALAGVLLAAASFAANADILFTNLGENAPPTTLGSHALTPFATAPQTAIPEFSFVSSIPGNPFSGQVGITPNAQKYTATVTWGTDPWPGPYVGPIYFSGFSQTAVTLSLPANTTAFYFYMQGNGGTSGVDTVTLTTNSGATSGPVMVTTGFWEPNVGANGFAFHTTAGESITSITIQSNNTTGFAVGNFGISAGPTTTCASEGYTGTKLEWCKNICERGYTGSTLNMWIRRWIDRYRQLPYCGLQAET